MNAAHSKEILPGMILHPRVGIGVLVEKNGKVLLGQRKSSHGEYTWAPPGGHLEFCESVTDCAARELLEETGLKIVSCSLGPWVENVMDDGRKHYISIFVTVTEFEGEIHNLEPDKCISWQWFPWDDLPMPLFPSLESYAKLRQETANR